MLPSLSRDVSPTVSWARPQTTFVCGFHTSYRMPTLKQQPCTAQSVKSFSPSPCLLLRSHTPPTNNNTHIRNTHMGDYMSLLSSRSCSPPLLPPPRLSPFLYACSYRAHLPNLSAVPPHFCLSEFTLQCNLSTRPYVGYLLAAQQFQDNRIKSSRNDSHQAKAWATRKPNSQITEEEIPFAVPT